MKNKNPLFNIKSSKFFILTLLLILTANNSFSQWKTAETNNIKDDIIILYEVIYDKELSVEEKNSVGFLSEIMIAFNKDNLVECRLGNKLKEINNFTLVDYNTLKVYSCMTKGTSRKAIESDFKDPNVTVDSAKNVEPKLFFDYQCEKGVVIINRQSKDIYYTKKIGLKYCKQYKVDGFLMEYPGYSKTLGYYTVKAKKIVYDDLPNSFYSLAGYNIQTLAEYKKNIQLVRNMRIKKHGKFIEKQTNPFEKISKRNGNTMEDMLQDMIKIKPTELDRQLPYHYSPYP